MSFDDIPEDLACEILSRITDPGDRVRLAAVSRVFRDAEKAGVTSFPGSPSALVELGRGFQRIASVEKAFYWWRKAADHADARAMHEIAMCYYYGWGVKQDHTKAVEWFESASRCGEAYATLILGLMYEIGSLGDVMYEKNEAKAHEMYIKAIEQGLEEGIAGALGHIYYRGDKGVAVNKMKALMWFRAAAEHGDPNLTSTTLWQIYVRVLEAELEMINTD